MTNRRSQSIDVQRNKRNKNRRKLSAVGDRRLQLESLEDRRLMAIGPQLAGIQPNSAALLRDGQVLHLAPRELTFRFSDGEEIDPATLGAIQITRSGNDGVFSKSVATSDFSTNGAVIMDFTAVNAGEASNGISLVVIKNDLGANAAPRISVFGDSIAIELNTNAVGRTRARDLRDAINSNAAASNLVVASIRNGTNQNADITSPAITYSPLVLSGANAASVVSGFNTGTPLQIKFTAVQGGPAGNGIRVAVTKANAGGVAPPTVTVTDRTVNIVLNSNATNPTSAQEVVDAVNANAQAQALVRAAIIVGRPETIVGSRSITFSPLTLVGANDVPIVPGFVGLGDSRREVIVRFKENLPDDLYHIEILGAGSSALRDIRGRAFGDRTEDGVDNGVDFHANFELDLGAQVEAIVPQPITRNNTLGALEQTRNEIYVYFNNDDLFPQSVRSGEFPTDPTVVDPDFYQLIFTNDTLTNTDDVVYHPDIIDYDPTADLAVLTFARALEQLGSGNGTYRLRVGTDEPIPVPPIRGAVNQDPGDSFATALSTGFTLRVDHDGSAFAEGQTFTITSESGDSRTFEFDTGYMLQTPVSASSINDGDTFTIANGAQTVTFEFDRDSTVAANRVAIAYVGNESGAALADLMVAAINAESNLVLNAAHLGAGRIQLGGTLAHTVTIPATTALTLSNQPGVQTASAVAIRFTPAATMTAGNLASAIASAVNTSGLGVQATADGASVLMLQGKQFQAGTGVTGLTSVGLSSLILRSSIDPQPYDLEFPGAIDEPGHRDIPVESHFLSGPDGTPGATSAFYNFRGVYGADPQGNLLQNLITDNQKQRAREIFDLYSNYLGINFVESDTLGLTIVTGDLRALDPTIGTGPGGILGLAGGGLAIMDSAENWDDAFGQANDPAKQSWFETAMHEIGHLLGLGHTYDLPPGTIMGSEPVLAFGQSTEPVYPGDHDLIHGQYLFRPDSIDVDLYKVVLPEDGTISIETIAERLSNSSLLDSVLTVYRQDGTGKRELIARNDDYNSNDSLIELDLSAGTYYVGVSASGNADYNPATAGSGFGGRSQGEYELRLDFRAKANRTMSDSTGTAFDGDADGTPGGVFNFWLDVADAAHTVYVDKATTSPGPGTLANPYANLGAALTAVGALADDARRDTVIRVVGNAGDDQNPLTLADNRAYEIGFNRLGTILADGDSLDIPQGVTMMIDTGAIIKLRRAEISVGSKSTLIDRSGGALQVLGTPRILDAFGNVVRDVNGNPVPGDVYFTSIHDDAIGFDTSPDPIEPEPAAGDWGGLSFREDLDAADPTRFSFDDQGIFVNSVNHANLRYGGGSVVVDGVPQVVTPIHIVDARPTATYNTISRSADSAMAATPDSFEESNFHAPPDQKVAFAPDYSRVGPKIYGNVLDQNSINGLNVRVSTPAGDRLRPMTIGGRWDDIDIPHILSESLVVQGAPGGPKLEGVSPPVELVTLTAVAGGKLTAGDYNYRIVLVDSNGNEGASSSPTRNITLTGAPNEGSIRLNNLPPVSGGFVARRIYRSDDTANTVGTYVLVAEINGTDSSFTDVGTVAGGVLGVSSGVLRPRLDARLSIDPGMIVKLGGGAIEATFGGALYAEGKQGQEIVFTSIQDDTYGGSGSFDTSNNATQLTPALGDWGGIRVANTSRGSLDHAVLAYGGGTMRIEGGFAGFNPVEVIQSELRITNSQLLHNASGLSGAAGSRAGRGGNAPATIFVRGAQPVILDNTFVNNDGAVVSINVNALNAEYVTDPGRATYHNGEASTGLPIDIKTGFTTNEGPLVRRNRTSRNENNGMQVRGGTLTTEGVWDDTDIVHVVVDQNIVVPDFHTSGGLRLESSASESLVVKLSGDINAGTGFLTASGRPLDINDRIGGTLQVLGQPQHPVVLTSVEDCTVGAGFTTSGLPQNLTLRSNTCTEDAPVTPPSGFADIVIVMDESGSMAFAQTFSRQLVLDLEAALIAANVGDGIAGTNLYGLAGFGGGALDPNLDHEPGHAHPVGANGALFGTANEYDIAALSLVDTGSFEDGYEAIQFVLDNYTFRPNAEKFIILVSNEDRDVLNRQLTFGTTLAGLNAADITLEGILTVTIEDTAGNSAVALDANDIAYLADGQGGFTTTPNGRITNAFGTTVPDYSDLVFATDGVVGDIDQISAGGDVTTSFSAAMISQIVLAAGGGQPTIVGGDWGGVRLEEFANDRNVEVVIETEAPDSLPPGSNGATTNSQPVGALAPNEKSGDENLRLGFQVHGALSAPNDIDVYSFDAKPGTEVWLDVDRTSPSLDSVIELLDAGGRVVARSDNSAAESDDPTLLFRGANIVPQNVNPLAKSVFTITDRFTTNPRDSGMRVILPGSTSNSNLTTYYVRVRSSSANLSDVNAGLTSGAYQFQIRLREEDEFPGSTVRYSDIRFATNGIEVNGQPSHSPLTGEAAEPVDAAGVDSNDTQQAAVPLGNLLNTDRGSLSVAGTISLPADVDWYTFTVDYDSVQGTSTTTHASAIFDLDYADGMARANSNIWIFDANGNLILRGGDSNVMSDRPAPLTGSNIEDLSRGSVGPLDAFVGPVELPAVGTAPGVYFVAVASNAVMPAELEQYTQAVPANPFVRLEPINSINRVAEDPINGSRLSNIAQPPQVPVLFDNSSFVPFNLSDLDLFVLQDSGGNQTRLRVVDPFTGAVQNTVGITTDNYNDIAMHPSQGVLYAYNASEFQANDANTGILARIDPRSANTTSLQTVVGDDGIETYNQDPMNPTAAVRSNNGAGVGIEFNAIGIGPIGRPSGLTGYAIGNRGDALFGPLGVTDTRNLLYEFNLGTGAAFSNAPPGNRGSTQNPLTQGAWTNIVERAALDTANDPIGPGNTVALGADATIVTTSTTLFNITDGQATGQVPQTFVVDDGTGNTFTFEFNAGPEVQFLHSPQANITVRDGDRFFLDGVPYEFDTGSVIVVTGNGNTLQDGDTITITDEPPNDPMNPRGPITRTFEFDLQGGLNNNNNIAIPFTRNDTNPQIIAAIVNAINNGQFAVQAVDFGTRISLLNESNTVRATENAGGPTLIVDGAPGATGGALRIPVEESFDNDQFGAAIDAAIDTSPDASYEGTRLNFSGVTTGDFSQIVARGVFTDLGSSGVVTPGNLAVNFLAADEATDIADAMVLAINQNTGIQAIRSGPGVQLQGGAFFVSASLPIRLGGTAPGGDITGMAFIGSRMFAVSDAGGLFEINAPTSNFAFADYVETGTDLLAAGRDAFGNPGPIQFAGLTAGPNNAENGRFANMLFGIDVFGRLYAFDTTGDLQPIFADGQTSVDTGLGSVTGLAFSNLDFNLWHETNLRRGDQGHGVDPVFDGSRAAENRAGNNSLYFGFESRAANGIVTDAFSDPANVRDYDFPSGAHGSIISNPIDLSGYSAADQPTLYFTYYLDTERTNALLTTEPGMRDAFRVFAAGDDGNWVLVATNNSARGNGSLDDEYDDPNPFDGITTQVQELFDVGDSGAPAAWRQARVPLGALAGKSNVRLRFDFSTAGDMDVGDPTNTGEQILAIAGEFLRDGQTITLATTDPVTGILTQRVFEVDLGYTLVAPNGVEIPDGAFVTIDGRAYEFDTGNGLVDATRVAVPYRTSMNATEVAVALQRAILNNPPPPPTFSGLLTDEPNDTLTTALDTQLTGRSGVFQSTGSIGDNPNVVIDPTLDVDVMRVALQAGDQMIVDVDTNQVGVALDSFLRIFDANGNELLANDNANGPGESGVSDSYLEFTATSAGLYYVAISGAPNSAYNPLVEESGVTAAIGAYDITISVNDSFGTVRRNGNRVNLPNASAASESSLPSSFLEGAPGVFGTNVPLSVHAGMTPTEVAAEIVSTLAGSYASGVTSAFRTYENIVQLIGHSIVGQSPGSLQGEPFGVSADLPGDPFGEFEASTLANGQLANGFPGMLRARDNAHEGVYIDDLIVGFAERGEMVVNAQGANNAFVNNPLHRTTEIDVGSYQLEMRRAPEFGTSDPPPVPTLLLPPPFGRSFDTNEPLDKMVEFSLPAGNAIAEGQTFTIYDGVNTVTFEFDDNAINDGITAGRIEINFNTADTDVEVARAVRNAINSAATQSLLKVTAAASDGTVTGTQATSRRLYLFGNAEVSFTSTTTVDLTANLRTSESNDVITTAVDTGIQAAGSERFSAVGNIGDNPLLVANASQDVDLLRLQLAAGERITIDIDAFGVTNSLDSILRVFDATGAELAFSDDRAAPDESGFTLDSYIDFTAPADGTYFIGVSSFANFGYDPTIVGSGTFGQSTGDYTILIERPGSRIGSLETRNVDLFGDSNTVRDQGQTILLGNRISRSAQFGIVADAGGRDQSGVATGAGQFPHPGSVRNIQDLNSQRLAPGVVIMNNLLVDNDSGGIRFSGDDTAGMAGVVPFGRIVNNTIAGVGPVGIQVEQNASPTILNNVFFNLTTAITVDATSASTVIGGSVYQRTPFDATLGPGSNAIVLADTDPLFLDSTAGNYYLAPNSRAIDSALDSLQDRPALVTVKQPLGIGASPIQSPVRDVLGQKRVDDPTVASPSGSGFSIFKDRGAIDRADFAGPTAVLAGPQDNDALRLDSDARTSFLQLTNVVLNNFSIQLQDGVEPTDPVNGVGANDATVRGNRISVFRDNVKLEEGLDYRFTYDATNNIIRLTPLAGIWELDHVYDLVLSNSKGQRLTAPNGTTVSDGTTFNITDTSGKSTRFEYDTGYVLNVPATYALQVPAAGGAGIQDGETFQVTDSSTTPATTVTFEFDSNGAKVQGNTAIPFTSASSPNDIANAIVTAIQSTRLGLSPANIVNFGGRAVHLGSRASHAVTVTNSSLQLTGQAASVADGSTFTIDDGAKLVTFEFNATGGVRTGNIAIDFAFSNTNEQIADLIVAAVRQSGVGLTPTHEPLSEGQVHLGGTFRHVVNVTGSGLVLAGQPGATPTWGLQIPTLGGKVNGIVDGETFIVANGATAVSFEFDRDNRTTAGNRVIAYTNNTTPDQLANSIAVAIRNAGLNLTPSNGGFGVVNLGGTAAHSVTLTNSRLTQRGTPGVAPSFAIPFVPGTVYTVGSPIRTPQTTETEMAVLVANAINQATQQALLTGVVATAKDTDVLIDGAQSITGVPNIASLAIEDIAGNRLQPNRTSGETRFSILLGSGLDYGDAPAPYPTLEASNGARHTAVPGFSLGLLEDAEVDGQPNAVAQGDDLASSDDEDGVIFGSLAQGYGGTITVTATQNGLLDAWIDFNGNGSWNDAGERIFNHSALQAGANLLNVAVPGDATLSSTYARFRFSSAGVALPTGEAPDGEVEDYRVTILANPWRNPANGLDVDNDAGHNVSPIDALLIINEINKNGSRALPNPPGVPAPPPFFDTNGDTFLSPIDAKLVIDFLNASGSSEGEGASQAAFHASSDLVVGAAFVGPYDDGGWADNAAGGHDEPVADKLFSQPDTLLVAAPVAAGSSDEFDWLDDLASQHRSTADNTLDDWFASLDD